MAWLQLQSIESLFDSSYGYILVIKLCVIAPMIALDAYHQFRLHYAMIQIAQMKESGSQEQFGSTSDIFEKRTSHINLVDQYDPFKRFSKTIKIESLIGISVLVVSSFLTITSPPSMVHSDSQMEMEMEEPESINSINDDSDMNQILPRITDLFTITALALAITVLIASLYYYRKSKQNLKITVNLLQNKEK